MCQLCDLIHMRHPIDVIKSVLLINFILKHRKKSFRKEILFSYDALYFYLSVYDINIHLRIYDIKRA
jgi:hypothetical protein